MNKRKNTFDGRKHIEQFNDWKHALQLRDMPFSRKTIMEFLKSSTLPKSGSFGHVFCNSGIFKKVDDRYVFATKDPIHFEFLNKIYAEYQEYSKKHRLQEEKVKPKTHDANKQLSEMNSTELEQYCIKYLKSLNYKIMKQKIEYIEI
jgi:hypothetical protein